MTSRRRTRGVDEATPVTEDDKERDNTSTSTIHKVTIELR